MSTTPARPSMHRTFDVYCKVRWGFTHRHANRLILASEVNDNLGPMGPKPSTERQVRPLAQLPAEGTDRL